MKDGFLKVSVRTPKIKVGDVLYNTEKIIKEIKLAKKDGVKALVFPELAVTGKTADDLFLQPLLIKSAESAVSEIAKNTDGIAVVVGYPASVRGVTYNAAAVMANGTVLGIVPKTNLTNEENRYFAYPSEDIIYTKLADEVVPFGKDLLFQSENMDKFVFGVEIGEDLTALFPESSRLSKRGALMVFNPSATLMQESLARTVNAQSERAGIVYVLSSAGGDESTTDLVYSGENIISMNGIMMDKNTAVTDLEYLNAVRQKKGIIPDNEALQIRFKCETEETVFTKKVPSMPYIKEGTDLGNILNIQATALKKRLIHTNAKSAVLGISGGLDSTLALLVTARAFDMAGLSRAGIIAITMPCFGTTDRTYQNSKKLISEIGATFEEIDIKKSVRTHFADIRQDENNHDVTYENAQARERTQVLMDRANQVGALVVGTGDMSELALGWATYNGDHMSMYAVNAGVPKTLVRLLTEYEADRLQSEVLKDILDTPISPELLPPTDGEISQVTEDIVGPYELHDFFMYCYLKCNYPPKKIFRLAKNAFAGVYDDEEILKWLKTFTRRFFSQQFKRNCMPDGPMVLDISLSPRKGLYMPSDALWTVWEKEIDGIEIR
ncbi:MAG: NAD(+) synthase [Clostridia bacterium]|nr:NAD(+) synthase [Clostridia bacterium]